MVATITLADRQVPLPIHDETLLRRIIDAVALQSGETFRVPRPAPTRNARRVVTVFTTAQVTGINANGVDLLDAPNPTSVVGVAA